MTDKETAQFIIPVWKRFGQGKSVNLESIRMKFVAPLAAFALSLAMLTASRPALAEVEWISVTFDNDLFVGNDSGYTNGIFVSWYDGPEGSTPAEFGLLASLMKWSLPQAGATVSGIGIKTIGQTMMTPDDISEDPPVQPPDDLPYGGMLYYRDSYIQVHSDFADLIAVTIGVVGESSFAEESQTLVHKLVGAQEPCCWDTQLDDEVVFQLSRGRTWRAWASDNDHTDFLLDADLNLGTISSSVGAGFMVRYGRNMKSSYPTALLSNSRIMNPVATRAGWYVFAGARAHYTNNIIFFDGSKSYDDDLEEIDYDKDSLSVTGGLAYAWKSVSLTFAINDANISNDNDVTKDYTNYGTLTLAFKLD